MAGSDRPSPAGRDAVPSLSRRKRGRPGRWTSQLLLLRPRPSAWPVTSSNKLRPAASGVTAPSPGPRALPFPPICSEISAPPPSWPPCRRLSDRKTSWPAPTGHLCRRSIIFARFCWLSGHFHPPSHHFCSFLSVWRSIIPVRPSFSAVFAGLTVIFIRQAIIFAHFCRLGGQLFPSGRHFRPFLTAQRSSSSAKPSFLLIFVGLAVNYSRQAIIFGHFCRLGGRHGRLDRPSVAGALRAGEIKSISGGSGGGWTGRR